MTGVAGDIQFIIVNFLLVLSCMVGWMTRVILSPEKKQDIAHVIQLVNWNYIYTYRKPYVHR